MSTMSLHAAFSTNLSRLCAGQRSIAAVCEGLNINRQQFGRYLAGRSLPNKSNLRKICRYFGIAAGDLFAESNARTSDPPTGDISGIDHEQTRALLKRLFAEPAASLKPGLYFAHFADPSHPGALMRSTVVVRRDGRHLTFRRLTAYCEAKNSYWSHFSSDHQGIVLERRQWIYFVGFNGVGDEEPTLLAVRYLPSAEPLLGGHAAILSPVGPGVTAVVVSRCPPKTNLRTALRQSHAFTFEDSGIDPIVIDALEAECRKLVTALRPLDLTVNPIPETQSVMRTSR